MICFTGHRPQEFTWRWADAEHAPGLRALNRAILDVILDRIEEGERDFMSGMALGVDTWAAEMVLYLRDDQHFPIRLHAAIPCVGQELVWSAKQQEKYFSIIKLCDTSVTLSKRYTAWCMTARNRYMVDHSKSVIAVYHQDKKEGGTADCVAYAKKVDKHIDYVKCEDQPTHSDIMNHIGRVKELLR